ncbi:exodeoxyribonuclease V subunit beta [Methylococcus capsulatus]|uniref:exodeoxyribonuclease V subunit beta n=1 Tax=Methylococcus capsulatus TaxID=414 RepID=UPI001C52989B|nr:exodeoxyribonuclease V subunit beta [Methylococcus capsulatus]QXP88510.1 exodeoxyribonuclease V subunit beta [Methylococcus capsulatus]QXP94474.1 exodeoxyribonuclease V subunit beta [Methylococcus capsulatus]UQN13559.1 exodeoxyribonuclease V subunit beta [Methylococcus capsulatus]
MSAVRPLDVFRCPLAGVNLIEASAGTGKTWNICGLYLRLLLEQEREVQNILVVTFTNAATAELRERIRSRIVETLVYLRGGGGAADPFVTGLVAALEGGFDRALLRQRLERALLAFDEAAIFTIHGFCQRALAGTPFAAGLPFALELVQDDAMLAQEVANDFWRRRVAAGGLSRAMIAHLLEAGDDPEKYASLLGHALAKPLSDWRWPEPVEPPDERDEQALLAAFGEARRLWQADAFGIVRLLEEAIDQLNGVSYKAASLETARKGWDAWFATNDPLAPVEDKVQLFRAAMLKGGTKKGNTTPYHPFFDAAENLLALKDGIQGRLAVARLGLLRELVEHGAEALRAEKRRRRVIGFDDMLWNVHDALTSGCYPWLAPALRSRYPVALIDEFQDTDPLQFAIFRALYLAEGAVSGPVFFVGDPKQAIYGFRNADLYTYLGARHQADREYTLVENQRSVTEVIDACNALFGANPRAFLLEGLEYRPVRPGAKPRPVFTDVTEPRSPFQVWLLPRDEAGGWLPRTEAVRRCTDTTAAEIARLIQEGMAGRIRLGERALRASDIAVLVRRHAQGRLIRQALARLGVGSVELSQASVFHTLEAEEIERILLAVLEPGRDRLLRAALATEIMGCDALTIAGISADEDRLLEIMLRFGEYRELWQLRGFGPMYRRLLHDEGVARRVLAQPDGERRLTNLLHLGELLHQAQAGLTSPDALLRWLQSRRRDSAAQEDAQLRLESDQNLVQIVTIHKSKGLEYPVVFCPYLWDGNRGARGEQEGIEYHDESGVPVLDFRPEAKNDPGIKWLRRQEEDAETLRLIYVALTRAVQRCYLFAGVYRTKRGASASCGESTRSMLNWLACGKDHSPEQWQDAKTRLDPAHIEAGWRALPDAIGVAPMPAIVVPAMAGPSSGLERLAAQTPPAWIPPGWSTGSFTSLVRAMEAGGEGRDHDALSLAPALGPPPAALPENDILRFPRGAAAGTCIHHLFEQADFTDPAGWDDAIGRALALRPQGSETAAPAMLKSLLADVLATDLGDGLRLSEIGRGQRLSELAFRLPAEGMDPVRLNALLRDHGYAMGKLDFRLLSGYLQGAIDLVFRHRSRYYLLDWKSNHLGYTREDYGPPALAETMAAEGYHLQYLLYTVALDRYLARRLPGYAYTSHFGGVYYLFVRGVRPAWRGAGVYFQRPAEDCIAALDALIGGRRGA